MGIYRERVLPRVVEATCGGRQMAPYRRAATAGLTGEVVEVGFGSGLNVEHYPAGVERVWAVEPSPGARRRAISRIEAAAVPVEFVGLEGEHLPLDDRSADHVLTTWTLCTIPGLDAALAEMRRVLRPGGTLHFVEHGRHPDPKVQRWQRRLSPVQGRLFGGCRLDVAVDERITAAGFTVGRLAHHTVGPRTFGYLYEGTATAST